MDRRRFLQRVAATTAVAQTAWSADAVDSPSPDPAPPADVDITGQTQMAEFKFNGATWKVYEDLSKRDGSITFVPDRGSARVMGKRTEATFTQAEVPHLGLKMEDITASGPDLLANKLLEHGDPDPIQVRDAAPPLGSTPPDANNRGGFAAGAGGVRSWNTFVGTKECYDTMPVYAGGNTRTYHPNQYFPEITGATAKRWEGLLGGWMPAVHKVFPISDTAYIEAIIFGDVEARDKFIVQTWHRTARVENGKITNVVYGYSYPAFPPARLDPKPEEFYRALLVFANYWDKQLADVAPTELPDRVWVDMSRYAVAKELMVRPGGVYPKYGAVDRDYYGSEYDGFQDIFTASVFTNLELGRFEPCKAILDNYLTDFTDAKGMINMRGPETAQFGLTLSLIARYLNYTHDTAQIQKHRGKIEATAAMLLAMHDESLKLPEDAPGHGLIHGWSESDACLAPKPETWWQPYYANSAFAARGLKDLSRAWSGMNAGLAQNWLKRANIMQETTIRSMEKWRQSDRNPPYVPLMPGSKLTFKEAMRQERPSPQQWPHRPYAELVMADILPHPLANQVVETMRNYGATTIGVLANVGGSRAVLGFIAYGFAEMLLRLDRVEEFILFLYSHRFHDHTPGSWTAGEVAGINGGTATFCIPAQQTIPIVVRWMLALEDSDEDRLYFGKGLPREWVASGKTIRIDQAPTRWGRVNFKLAAQPSTKSVSATVELARSPSPKEVHVKLRMPSQSAVKSATVNGRPATLGGVHGDTVVFEPGNTKHFEIVGQCG
ncbi:MAG TPA: hypothetical protein VKU19_41325 [Bryobacteraceae bacterium]|nr:hypothetical protein [Bryobacteraceae bacterium]